MNDNKDTNSQPAKPQNSVATKPNETGSVYIESFIKIHDPNTQEVLVEKRA
jgi:hypothetical protein